MKLLSLILFSLLPTVALAQTPASSPPPFSELAARYTYDRTSPLDFKEHSSESRDAVRILDISYSSPIVSGLANSGLTSPRVPAYLVLPPANNAAKCPCPVILFGHWMMPGSPFANRTEFLDEAVLLARSGVISLLLDAPQNRPGLVRDPAPMSQQDLFILQQQVIDFRRGIDLLVSRPDVDATRIAYVGHSFDAHVGGILSGVEKRIRAFVLMAGGLALADYMLSDIPRMVEFRKSIGEEKVRADVASAAWADPAHFIARAAPAPVFLQFGKLDEPLPLWYAQHTFKIVSEPKEMQLYDSGHALDSAARLDRVRWLARHLSFPPPPDPAVLALPQIK